MTEVIKDPHWTLEISSFRGISPGAVHWYGTLKRSLYQACEDDSNASWYNQEQVRLEHRLSTHEATVLNKADQERLGPITGSFLWKPGNWYSGFWKREQVLEAAKEVWPRLAGPEDFLTLEDRTGESEYGEVLIGSNEGYEDPSPGGFTRMGFGNPLKDVYLDMSDIMEGR